MQITLTEKATKRLQTMIDAEDKFLRIEVVAGGCSGNTYNATLDQTLTDNDDVIYEQDGIRIVADPRSSLFLDGLNIDYSDDLITAGFRLTNANAKASCGCGASFSV